MVMKSCVIVKGVFNPDYSPRNLLVGNPESVRDSSKFRSAFTYIKIRAIDSFTQIKYFQ